MPTDISLVRFLSSMASTTTSVSFQKSKLLIHFALNRSFSTSFRTNKEAKVNNFYKIEDALRFLQVRFDGKMIHNIMQEERGAALRLLYQLKRAIELRQGAGPTELEETTLTGLKKSTVDRKISERLGQTKTLAGTIKARTVGGKDIRTAKQKLQDNHLIKYEVAQKLLFEDAQANGKAEAELIATI